MAVTAWSSAAETYESSASSTPAAKDSGSFSGPFGFSGAGREEATIFSECHSERHGWKGGRILSGGCSRRGSRACC